MKKVLVAVALVMGLGTTTVVAGNVVMNGVDVESVMAVNEFKPIDIKELPQTIQDSIKKNFPESGVKDAAVEVAEDETKTYKVTLVDGAGTESAVFFNEKGEVLK